MIMNIASNQAYQKGDSHAAISLLVYPIIFSQICESSATPYAFVFVFTAYADVARVNQR